MSRYDLDRYDEETKNFLYGMYEKYEIEKWEDRLLYKNLIKQLLLLDVSKSSVLTELKKNVLEQGNLSTVSMRELHRNRDVLNTCTEADNRVYNKQICNIRRLMLQIAFEICDKSIDLAVFRDLGIQLSEHDRYLGEFFIHYAGKICRFYINDDFSVVRLTGDVQKNSRVYACSKELWDIIDTMDDLEFIRLHSGGYGIALKYSNKDITDVYNVYANNKAIKVV